MNKTIFFQASMPRAGSTLLQNIIGQNPDFYVTPTSGVTELISGSIKSFSNSLIFKSDPDYNTLGKNKFYNFCKEGINGYYSNINQKFILEKNRSWLSHLDLLDKIYHTPKVICLVRDIRSIFCSYEKIYLNDFAHKFIVEDNNKFGEDLSISQRINFYNTNQPLLGTKKSIFNLIESKNKNKVHFIRFEDLCTKPHEVLNRIYNYLEIPKFQHNFNQIDQITHELDNILYFADHTIKNQLSSPPSNWDKYLPPYIQNEIYKEYEWYFKYFNYKL